MSHHKFLEFIIRIIGVLQILIGLVAAYYGPLEIYVFYLFSDGGPFHYAGFGVGSLWFALLVVQNMAYYVLAGLLLPVGIGTIKLRRWALTLSVLYVWMGLAMGMWTLINLITLIPAILNLDLSPDPIVRLTIVGAFASVLLVLVAFILLKFYGSKSVRLVFEQGDPRLYWTETYPFPLLGLLFLFAAYLLAFHVMIFFQAVFPWFGSILIGRQPVYLIALCIVLLLGLMYGVYKVKLWAWWGSMLYFSWLTMSAMMTATRYSLADIVDKMSLPEVEREFLASVTILEEYHPVVFLIVPLLGTLGLIIYSKRYFSATLMYSILKAPNVLFSQASA